MYCNIVFMIDIFVISKITQYRYYVIAITDVRSLGLSTKWRTLMIKKTMKVRENTFRKLEDPFENGAAKKYVFYVKVDDVAEGIPMATNPRDQKLTSGVATAIKESLLSNDGYFHLKNRGIVLSAESVHYNNKEKIATIIFSDELSHGNIDGGHTYKIVCEHKGENLEQYVQFEVMTGVEDIIENLAEARNTSVTKLVYGSIYRSVFIEEILENDKYDTVEKLLKLKPEQYVKFLEYIVDVIINRNKQLQDILQEENGHE